MGTALFTHTGARAALCVANYTPPCPPTFQTLVHHTHTHRKSCLAFLNQMPPYLEGSQEVSPIVTVGLDSGLQRFLSVWIGALWMSLDYSAAPQMKRFVLMCLLSDLLKSLNKHFKAQFWHIRNTIVSWFILELNLECSSFSWWLPFRSKLV